MAGHRRAFMGAIARLRLTPAMTFIGPDAIHAGPVRKIDLLFKEWIAAGRGDDGLDQHLR